MTYVNNVSKALTGEIVPHIQASQKLIIKIRGANVSVHNIVIHAEKDIVNDNAQRARELLDNATATLNALLQVERLKIIPTLQGADFRISGSADREFS